MWQKGWMEGKEFTGEGNYSLLLGRKKHELKTRETKRKKRIKTTRSIESYSPNIKRTGFKS